MVNFIQRRPKILFGLFITGLLITAAILDNEISGPLILITLFLIPVLIIWIVYTLTKSRLYLITCITLFIIWTVSIGTHMFLTTAACNGNFLKGYTECSLITDHTAAFLSGSTWLGILYTFILFIFTNLITGIFFTIKKVKQI